MRIRLKLSLKACVGDEERRRRKKCGRSVPDAHSSCKCGARRRPEVAERFGHQNSIKPEPAEPTMMMASRAAEAQSRLQQDKEEETNCEQKRLRVMNFRTICRDCQRERERERAGSNV
jgi:hypothetical protein